MKTSVTILLILLSLASLGQQNLPPVPQDPIDLHLPDPGAKMRSAAILPAAVLGGFAFVASKAEPTQAPMQVLASLAVVGTTTLYLVGDYRKRKARRAHQ